MPFPTTQWGNIGNTLASTQVSADVYATAPGPTATAPGSANGPVLGNFQSLADGTFVQFLQAGGAIPANAACEIGLPWANVFKVTSTNAVGDLVVAINDRALAALSTNNCTWFTERGLAYPLVAAAVAAGAVVAASATGGTLRAATVGTDGQWDMINTVVVGGAAAASPVYMK